MENKPTFGQQMLEIQQIAKKSKIQAKAMFDLALKEKYDTAVAAAKPIIDQIELLAQKAAANGDDGCPIMDLKQGDDEYFSDYTSVSTNGMKPNADLPYTVLGVTAKTVFDYCKDELKIDTSAKQGITSYDERGMTYFKIWIYWKPKAMSRF